MWKYSGQWRPEFADQPGPGQESVWDYPRPPRLERDERRIEVRKGERVIASTRRAFRVLETASPPTFYIPAEDVLSDALVEAPGSSFCEWKGRAQYWSLAPRPEDGPVGWSYPAPRTAFAAIRDHVAFYPAAVACTVDGERVRPQPGGFYGGWITKEVVGPFKGDPGTQYW